MQENIKICKIDKKRNKLLKKNDTFLLKRLEMFYIFWASVSNVHKMLRRQTKVYVPTSC